MNNILLISLNISAVMALEIPSLAPDENKLSPVDSLGIIRENSKYMGEHLKNIIVVGGGFGGIAAILSLEKKLPYHNITLISDKPHHEYLPRIHRIVAGRMPLEICIPISEILKKKRVKFVLDRVTAIDPYKKWVECASGLVIPFDYSVIATGSNTEYYNISGLSEFVYSFKSIRDAIELKRRTDNLFEKEGDVVSKNSNVLPFVIVGAGAGGVEIAGTIASRVKALAREYGVSKSAVTIDIIEAARRIMPTFPKRVGEKVHARLCALGINVHTGHTILDKEIEKVRSRSITVQTDTIIWSAGTRADRLSQKISGLVFDTNRRVVVDEYLRATGFETIYVIGDSAGTPHSGVVQTAVAEGMLVAKNIIRQVSRQELEKYVPRKPHYTICVGDRWAVFIFGPFTFYGRLGVFMRRLADFRYFLSILPFGRAITVFRRNKSPANTCPICLPK